ncbi:hypothetical protein N2152v2_001666, partial [Parachlorella kessleri]
MPRREAKNTAGMYCHNGPRLATPPPQELAELSPEDGVLPEDLLLLGALDPQRGGWENGADGEDDGVVVHYAGDEEVGEWAASGAERGAEGSAAGPRPGGKRLPAEVRCFDTARIFVKGGDGGKGCVAFRREKYVPKGGPSGGNGGRGGHVYIEGDAALNSLMSFRRQVHFRAGHGTPGGGSDMHGAAGQDLVVRVPPGTLVRLKGSDPQEAPLAEVLKPGQRVLLAEGGYQILFGPSLPPAGQRVLLAEGGRGGRGNLAFKTARNTAPALAELGERGQ